MVTILGSGTLSYQQVDGWAKLPEGWILKECAGVAVDSKDRVYAFTRGNHPVIVFDRDGNVLSSWGEGQFKQPHGITIGPDDSVYLVDNDYHTVRKFTPEGELLMTLGKESPRWSGDPFNLPNHTAVSSKTGDLFIVDGYGNSRVHRYSSDGEHVMSWGASGIDPGQFVIPHNIAIDKDDNVYVADRENHRVQIFNTEGKVQEMWNNIWKPCGICIGNDGNLYIGELCGDEYFADAPDVGHRISIYTLEGKLLARLGDSAMGEGHGQFLAPHGVALDSHGDVYIAEVSWTMVASLKEPAVEMRSLQKLAKNG